MDRACVKKLTLSDVQNKLAVPSDMAAIMPPADPERNIPIRVLDDWGQVYNFYLSGRRGRYIKPVFQAKEWRAFIKCRGAKDGDQIYFWHEVDESKHTQYCIVFCKNYL
ncbi:hypothetical protein M0R45_009783 [Rubus argutus]|uniref:TF-B3 domain-containing protein n=1 Tax=Rubus argutus TaxID=59490 RepID=A0AAW1Y813_RUBAR